jgi:Arm domain-containing DNA-binding protein
MRDRLSALKVQTAKKPGRYADGGGLYLFIPRPGYKLWTFRYQLNGKPREMSLGPVSDVGLAEARDLAAHARRLTRDGKDPIEVRREAIAEHRVEQLRTMTFAQAAEQFLKTDKIERLKSGKHRA